MEVKRKVRQGEVKKYFGEEFGKKWKKTSNSPQLNTDVDFSVHDDITGLYAQVTKQSKKIGCWYYCTICESIFVLLILTSFLDHATDC